MYVFSVCQALDRCRALNLLNAVLQLSSLFVRTVLLIVLHFVSVGVFTLFVMFSCAPDPCRICQVILSPLVRFCSESFLCPIASINKILLSSSSSSSSSYTLFVMFSCAPDPCRICQVILSPLVRFCSESFLCPIAIKSLSSSSSSSRSSRHSPALENRHLSIAEGRGEDC